MAESGIGYVCGPLSELPVEERRKALRFYRDLGEILENVSHHNACIPHEHYDRRSYSPEIHEEERRQFCKNAWCVVIVVALPNWRGWEKVLAIAEQQDIPVVILCWQGLLDHRGHISPVLLGHPAVRVKIFYSSADETISKSTRVIGDLWEQSPLNQTDAHFDLALV